MKDSTIVITGAGSGIGQQTAFAFAARGAELELLDIDREGLAITARLARAAGARVETHVVDVSDAKAMDAVAARVRGNVSVLVNNAGIGAAGRFLDASLETWRRVVDVNLLGVVHGCRSFLPSMIARGGGHVVNIASAAGLTAPRDMSVYAATKFAVVGLSQSLRGEVAEHGIKVTCVCPGIVDTPIVERTRYEGEKFSASTQRSIGRLYRRRAYSPAKVAAAIANAIDGPGGILPVTPESWAMWLVERAAPGLMSRLGNASRLLEARP